MEKTNFRGGAFSAVRANEASTQEIALETGGLGAERKPAAFDLPQLYAIMLRAQLGDFA